MFKTEEITEKVVIGTKTEPVMKMWRTLGECLFLREESMHFECNYCCTDDYIFGEAVDMEDVMVNLAKHIAKHHPDLVKALNA